MKVAIVGCGFVGGALKRWLEEHKRDIEICVSDPYKGYADFIDDADIFFISIHIPTEADGSQDLTVLKEILRSLPPAKPIFVRTTVLPGTCSFLSKETGREVHFMPEFLTERTAYEDFCSQPMIFTAHTKLLQRIFSGKKFMEMSSEEAELAKYAHNVFGALKVTYFNGIYELCQSMGIDYENVRKGALLSGYISSCHTKVPGPDGKFGYGGKCFPKDVNALLKKAERFPLHDLLLQVQRLNEYFRSDRNA